MQIQAASRPASLYRSVLAFTLAAAGTLSMLSLASAGESAYPNRPVKILVGYGPGGSADNAARMFGDKLSAELGQSFIIENRPGAGATTAAGMLASAPNDGYTLMVSPTAVLAITPILRKTSYDPVKDITSVAKLTNSIGMITISNELPAKTLPEFIELAKKSPGKYSFGSSGVATITHLTGEVFQKATGTELLHVPYKTIVDGVSDLVAGRIAIVFDPFVLPQSKAGKTNTVASTTDARHPDFPDAPTLDELGIDLQGFRSRSWFGLFGPRDLPADVVERLNTALEKISRDPELAKTLLALGQVPDFMPASQFGPQVADDYQYFKNLIDELGIQLEP